MKTEHVNAIVRFIRRIQPTDLVLPIGAALISAGIQNLVDREQRQRQRLLALDELVDVHRGALAAAGVELPAELSGDEQHPLDIENAVGIILARTPSEPAPEPAPRPRRFRTMRGLAVLGLAGGAGVTVWARGYARAYGQEPTVLGFLTALRGPDPDQVPAPSSSKSSDPNGSDPNECSSPDYPTPDNWNGDRCTTCERAAAWFRDDQVWLHVSPITAEPYAMLHDVTLPPAVNEDNRPLGHEGSDRWTGGDRKDEGVIGHGEPPLEECGWTGCDWSSDATRNDLSQQTAAAVHRNRCIYRPAGAKVAE